MARGWRREFYNIGYLWSGPVGMWLALMSLEHISNFAVGNARRRDPVLYSRRNNRYSICRNKSCHRKKRSVGQYSNKCGVRCNFAQFKAWIIRYEIYKTK